MVLYNEICQHLEDVHNSESIFSKWQIHYVTKLDMGQRPIHSGLPRWFSVKECTCQAGNVGSIPGSRRSPGEGNGNPFQYSCLENYMKRGAWWATVHGVAESDTTEWLNWTGIIYITIPLHIFNLFLKLSNTFFVTSKCYYSRHISFNQTLFQNTLRKYN